MRRRIAILAAIAAVVATAVVLIVLYARGHRTTTTPVAGRGDGGAAIHAPAGPQLPDQGTRITGV
ncbi:MAG TPA: hypothetical protein VFV99_34020, partial [Kofleriaceae bacterium]|nr:hypothetical protein [Kofleriaceae bacterium]